MFGDRAAIEPLLAKRPALQAATRVLGVIREAQVGAKVEQILHELLRPTTLSRLTLNNPTDHPRRDHRKHNHRTNHDDRALPRLKLAPLRRRGMGGCVVAHGPIIAPWDAIGQRTAADTRRRSVSPPTAAHRGGAFGPVGYTGGYTSGIGAPGETRDSLDDA